MATTWDSKKTGGKKRAKTRSIKDQMRGIRRLLNKKVFSRAVFCKIICYISFKDLPADARTAQEEKLSQLEKKVWTPLARSGVIGLIRLL